MAQVQEANSKEYPLKHFALLVRLCGKAKLVVLVIVLEEVQQDSSSLEDNKVISGVIDEDGDASVRVQFEEP